MGKELLLRRNLKPNGYHVFINPSVYQNQYLNFYPVRLAAAQDVLLELCWLSLYNLSVSVRIRIRLSFSILFLHTSCFPLSASHTSIGYVHNFLTLPSDRCSSVLYCPHHLDHLDRSARATLGPSVLTKAACDRSSAEIYRR